VKYNKVYIFENASTKQNFSIIRAYCFMSLCLKPWGGRQLVSPKSVKKLIVYDAVTQ